jgi:hypothetical protein
MIIIVAAAVSKTTILLLIATITKPTMRTILTGKPINSRDILNTGKASINPSSMRCADIPEMSLCILMEAQSQAVEAKVWMEVANVQLIAIEVHLGM